jgi:hypothetical protein
MDALDRAPRPDRPWLRLSTTSYRSKTWPVCDSRRRRGASSRRFQAPSLWCKGTGARTAKNVRMGGQRRLDGGGFCCASEGAKGWRVQYRRAPCCRIRSLDGRGIGSNTSRKRRSVSPHLQTLKTAHAFFGTVGFFSSRILPGQAVQRRACSRGK